MAEAQHIRFLYAFFLLLDSKWLNKWMSIKLKTFSNWFVTWILHIQTQWNAWIKHEYFLFIFIKIFSRKCKVKWVTKRLKFYVWHFKTNEFSNGWKIFFTRGQLLNSNVYSPKLFRLENFTVKTFSRKMTTLFKILNYTNHLQIISNL